MAKKQKIRKFHALRNMRRTQAMQKREARAIRRETYLAPERIESRARIATEAAVTRESRIPPTTEHVYLHCRKSGTICGELTGDALVAYLDLPASDRTLAISTAIHPAWLNTSPANLRTLQLSRPYEFVVYSFAMLAGNNMPAHERGAVLKSVQHWPLETAIEFAELGRRALALFGRHEAVADSLDFDPRTHDAQECLQAMHSWIAAWISVIQRRYHANNADRARVITLADAKTLAADLGMPLFRESRVGDADDFALLADISEIFSSSDIAEMRAAVAFRAKKTKKNASEEIFAGIDFQTESRIINGMKAPESIIRRAATATLSVANASRPIMLFAKSKN